MSDESVPVTPEVASRVLARLRDRLPEGWRLMPIGGTEMAQLDDETSTTKDIDVVIVTVREEEATIPEYDDLVAFATELSENVQTRKDHTSVKVGVSTDAGRVTVEFVRGRTPGKGGYFVSRTVLERAATLAVEERGVLRLPMEALAFLKAWAAHDKEKLVEAGKDARGYHVTRRDAFLEDVMHLRRVIADEDREPDPDVFRVLFTATGGERAEAVRGILAQRQWPV